MNQPRLFITCLWIVSAVFAHADWPQFRGPFNNGHVTAPGSTTPTGLPVKWSETENVKWKIPIPHRGWSTPAIMEGKVWLTTATLEGHDFFVICVDAATGNVLLNEKLFHTDAPEPLGGAVGVNCYASPSPVVEPGRVYVHFGSYGTACLDTGTFKVLWKREDLACRHFRGPGSSLALFKDYLLITMDGIDQQYLAALDKKTGQNVWRADRTTAWNDLGQDGKPAGGGDFRKGFTTPLVIEVNGKPQVISAGSKAAYSYDATSGRELWKVRYPAHTPAATAVFGHGLVFLTTGNSPTELMAIRPTGEGDVTSTNIVWKTTRGAPRMPSPLLVDDLLYVVADNGVATCWEATTGKELWQERVGGDYFASPIYADGRIYCFNNTGASTVLKAGRTYEVLTKNTLEAGLMASPAVAGKALILRTKTHLYRIEEGASR